jgi:NitT/TauT family transport system permease protein
MSVHKKMIYTAAGVVFIIVIWHLMSMIFSEFVVASPAATAGALWKLACEGELWRHFGYSLARLLIGVGTGAFIGVSLGILAGLNSRIQSFLEPLRWTIMTVPAIIITVLAMLWFGMGSIQVIFMTAVITLPINYVNTLEGMLAVDKRIMEMACVYRIPFGLRLRRIYLPGIGASIMAGLTLAAGIGVRASILAEFMGARNGIGHNLFLSWSFLDTPSLFAWIIAAFILLGLVEFAALRPVRNRLSRWKRSI